ncbi:unnamed protein product [Boreogadus saida]
MELWWRACAVGKWCGVVAGEELSPRPADVDMPTQESRMMGMLPESLCEIGIPGTLHTGRLYAGLMEFLAGI